ncbi:DoxX family protein [Paenactinomyces guangxiensis]|uniref:DoxX family protein n=1 Tax=Paenactinomyces guangxiensis TaxID=1490290 RepID=A0A7W2A9A5_9BACL|nr:DoxX family protein [Paenactinomyces guangxiensis]MBA4496411.1 DoxX family protein [Paenactinomyces guangxiensis]MBH8593482.1 DoxX family protein [Paenactinomyces guangxiensis]
MERRYEIGLLLLRITFGLIFFVHGLAKFQGGIEKTAGFFSSLGLPGFAAYPVAVIELAGGLAIIVGLGTRIVSALLALIMLGAIFTAKLSAGFIGGYELDLILLAVAVHLLLSGSRFLAVDSLFTRR